MGRLKLASVNIEADKHLPLVQKFLENVQPDVVCLQEVFQADLETIAPAATWQTISIATSRVVERSYYDVSPRGAWGNAILLRKSTTQLLQSEIHTYKGDPNQVPNFVNGEPNSVNRAVILTEVTKDGQTFFIATTHFTWTIGGTTTPEQFRDWKALQKYLSKWPKYILCGDLNAPRGGEMGKQIETEYRSHLPTNITTTIDGSLHHAGNLQFVVDYLLSKGNYKVSKVQVVSGVSDHCALVAEISASQTQ